MAAGDFVAETQKGISAVLALAITGGRETVAEGRYVVGSVALLMRSG